MKEYQSPLMAKMPEGYWVTTCSRDCAADWVKAKERPPRERNATFKPLSVSDSAPVCTHCYLCGKLITEPQICLLHNIDCPRYAWLLSLAAVHFPDVWTEETGGSAPTDADWDDAERVANEYEGVLTAVEIVNIVLEIPEQ